MTGQDYEGTITSVQATSSYVKVQIDTVPGKVFTWRMTQFTSKPYPEVGKRIVLTARSGRLSDYDVQQLISITDAPAKEPVSTEITPEIVTKIPDQAKPIATILADRGPPSGSLDELAAVIVDLRDQYEKRILTNILELKWLIGKETVARRATTEESYRELNAKTGISHSELARCVQFFEKFPDKGYELKAWRRLRAELPEKAEAAEKPALVVDEKHLWTCPECGVRFEHLHAGDGRHRLREVETNPKAE